MSNWISLDIETVPNHQLLNKHKDNPKIYPQPSYGNATKEETRAKKLKEWTEAGGVAKAAALNPWLCKIVCYSMYGDEDSLCEGTVPLGSRAIRDKPYKDYLRDLLFDLIHIIGGMQRYRPLLTCNGRPFDLQVVFIQGLMNKQLTSALAHAFRQSYLEPAWRTQDSHIDLFDHVKGPSGKFLSLEWMREVILGLPARVSYADKIEELIAEDEWETVEAYCLDDAKDAYNVAEKLLLI